MARPKTLRATLPGLWRIFRHLRPYIRKQRLLVFGSFVALFMGVGLRALEPWPLKYIFDRIITPSLAGQLGKGFDPVVLLILAALALVIIIGLRALATYYNRVGFALVGNRVLTEVRGVLYRHLQCLSLSFHHRSRTGDLIIRVISDTAMLKEVAVTAFMPLLANILILVVMVGLMLWFHWKLALVSLAVFPLYWIPTLYLSRQIQQASRKQRQREGAMASTAAESMGAIQIVQTFSLEETFSEAFSQENKRSLKEGVKVKRLTSRLEGTVGAMIGVSTALVLGYGTYLVLEGAITPGGLLVFLSYLKSSLRPMQDFAKYTARLAKASASGERILDLLERTPDIQERPDALPASRLRGAIQFEDVDFSYEPGHPVLKRLNLTVDPGQHVALVGPSGNGKSTLVSLILRLYDPTAGQVLVDGKDIR